MLKSPSQLVFVSSMAISQEDRIAVPFPELPPRACRRPEVVDGLRAQDQLFEELVPIRPGDLPVLQGPLAWFSSRITISVKLACGGWCSVGGAGVTGPFCRLDWVDSWLVVNR